MPDMWKDYWTTTPLEGVGVSYSSEATALFARFTTPPDAARKALIDALIVSLKTAGVWAKLDALYVMAAADSQAARRNWIADQFNLTAASSPTFTADRGYQGDGATSSLTTAFNPTSAAGLYVQNSANAGFWSLTNSAADTFDMGVAGTLAINPRTSGGVLRGQVNDGTAGNFDAQATSIGHTLITRTAAGVRTFYKNGAAAGGGTTASTAVPNAVVPLLRLGSSGYSARQLAAAHLGSGLSAQNASDLYTALNTYLTAVGAA